MARNDHSGYPLKWFKDQNRARHAYECVVCLEVLKDPVQVRDCGHQFCALCIDDVLKADPHCPNCRIEISDATVFDDHAARRLIKQLEVNCCNEGCIWNGTLSSLLQDHQKKCNYSIQNVHGLKVEKLEQEFQALTEKVLSMDKKHEQDMEEHKLKHEQDMTEHKLKCEQDIKELRMKYEQDIEEIKLKHEKDVNELKLKNEEDIKDLKLKYERDIHEIKLKHENDVKELELKIQQSDDRLQRLEEREKEPAEDENRIIPVVEVMPEKCEKPLEEDLSWEDKGEKIAEEIKVENETKPEPPKKKSSKQRFKDINKKETRVDLMDAYTDKPPPQELVVEEKARPVEKPLEEDLSWEDKGEIIGEEIKVENETEPGPAGPVKQTTNLLVSQNKSVGSERGGSDFLPSYARQKSQGGGGRRDSRGKPPPRKIIAAARGEPVVPDVKETVGPAVEVIPEAMEVDHQEIIIKEDNAEPAGPVKPAKRKYDREFLLQLRFLPVCMEKPAGLPNMEIVLDSPVFASKAAGAQRGRSDFFPSYARQKGQRCAVRPVRRDNFLLKQNENPWLCPEQKEKDLSGEEKKTAELYRNVMAILNKLTPQNYETLLEQIMTLNVDTSERLEGVIDRIFEKAIREPRFSVAYANMCRYLFGIKVADAEGKDVSFWKLLLNRCQKESEDQKLSEKFSHLEGLPAEEKKVKKEEMDEALGKNKRRMLGNIKFMGELFKLKLLPENIMHDCVFKLLRAGDEESLESMCLLLYTIGKALDSDKAKFRMDQCFDQIDRIIAARKISFRVIFMLRDVVELRANKWVPLREENHFPMFVDHANKTQPKKMQERKLAAKKDKRKKGGRDNPRSNDGWITTDNGGKNLPIDQNKLRNMAKRVNNEEISLGPSSRFGQWGRGNGDAGLSRKQEQEQEQKVHQENLPSSQPNDSKWSSKSSSTDDSGDEGLQPIKFHNEKQTVLQTPVMMQAQQPQFIPGHGMPIAQRPMQGNRIYSASAQAHSRMQGFNLQPSMPPYPVVAQDAYVQQMVRHAYIPNVPQYQMPAASAQFSPQFIPQQPQYFNQPMQAQPNQPIQAQANQPIQQPQQQQPTQTQNTAIQTNNINKPKPKRTSKITIRDPRYNKDVTEEILHSSTSQNLTFLSTERNDGLLRLLQKEPFQRADVIDYIERHFREDERRKPQFIRRLVTGVAECCIVNTGFGTICCGEDKLKARKDVLRRYLPNVTLEVEALHALEEIYMKYNEPAGVLSKFFHTLYDEVVITEKAFMTWLGVDNPATKEGKASALQETAEFFNWLLD